MSPAPRRFARVRRCRVSLRTLRNLRALSVKLFFTKRGFTFMNLKDLKLTWLGHATFRIETPGGKTVIIDPWVMNNPMCPEAEKKLKKVDILLCTHGHGDHIGDAVEICKKYNSVAVGIPELARWLGKKGAKQLAEMNKGGTQTVGDIKVTMV